MKIGTGYGAAAALLLIVGAAAYSNIGKMVDAAAWVEHVHDVREQLDHLLTDLQDAETGQRGFIITGEESYLDPYVRGVDGWQADIDSARAMILDPGVQANLARLLPLATLKFAELDSTISLRRSLGFNAAREIVMTNAGKQTMDELRAILGTMDLDEDALIGLRMEALEKSVRATRAVIIGGTLLSLVIFAALSYWITQRISGPVRELAAVTERVASGDLTVTATSRSRDEIGRLTELFDGMIVSLRTITREVLDAVPAVTSSATQLQTLASELAATSQQAATTVAETFTTINEVKQTAEMSAGKARQVADAANQAVELGRTGEVAVKETVERMTGVREQMDSIAASVLNLSEQSKSIAEIISTVNDLADQSNLLAVNAAIEAARAGEQGKGFVVVAQEVRSLAEQSKRATEQVRVLLNDIQKATSGAVMATEQGNKAANKGMTQSAESGRVIQLLAGSVVDASEAAAQIAAASQQQLVGTDQVTVAIDTIRTGSEQAVSGIRQVEAAAQGLTEMGRRLEAAVQRYSV